MERDPIQATVGVSVAKITLISYRRIMNELWAGWVIFGEHNLFLLKACLCSDGKNATNQRGNL